METFGLKIIASDRVFYEGRCRQIVIPAYDGGTIGILPNHENMVLSYAGFSCQGDEPFESITWKALECVNIVDNHKRTVQKDFLCRNCMVLFLLLKIFVKKVTEM